MEVLIMIDKFLQNPQTNTLAVIVLILLIAGWIVSLLLMYKDKPVSHGKNWFTKMLLVFALPGIPAILDLLQTNGAALIFAIIGSLALIINIAILILHLTEKTTHFPVKDWFKWSILILVVGGLAISGYFIFTELTNTTVSCGPSQGCGPVENSRYAKLYKDISMGDFGFVGYGLLLIGWLMQQYGPGSLRKTAALGIWGFCIFGVIFSIYLTFLEPFVIGATCMWCIMSAVFMLMLLLNATPAAQQAFMVTDG
jgi:uncharacterized membrane protein